MTRDDLERIVKALPADHVITFHQHHGEKVYCQVSFWVPENLQPEQEVKPERNHA